MSTPSPSPIEAPHSDPSPASSSQPGSQSDIPAYDPLKNPRTILDWYRSPKYYSLPWKKRLYIIRRIYCRLFALPYIAMMMVIPVCSIVAGVWWYNLPSGAPFADALQDGDLRMVTHWIEREGADINVSILNDFLNRPPLVYAAAHNQTEIVRYLLSKGASVEHEDSNRWSALHYAASNNNFEMTDLLLKAGANVNERDIDERTPLHVAAIEGHTNIAAALVINGGANMYALDSARMLPATYARTFKHTQLAQLFETNAFLSLNDGDDELESLDAIDARSGPISKKKRKKKGKKKRSSERSSSSPPAPSIGVDRSKTVVLTDAAGHEDIPSLLTAARNARLEEARTRHMQQPVQTEQTEQSEATDSSQLLYGDELMDSVLSDTEEAEKQNVFDFDDEFDR